MGMCSAMLLLFTYMVATFILMVQILRGQRPKDPKAIAKCIKKSHMYLGSTGAFGLACLAVWVRMVVFMYLSYVEKCGGSTGLMCKVGSIFFTVIGGFALLLTFFLLWYEGNLKWIDEKLCPVEDSRRR